MAQTRRVDKGFVAFDVDGTALVQMIDQHPTYGLQQGEAHVRDFLIEELKLAQNEGYDIYICTMRREFYEPPMVLLEGKVGTLGTQTIIDILEQNGIVIKGTIRTLGVKGKAMSDTMTTYTSENPGAIGILLDDLLGQVNDVKKIARANGQANLTAFDINSPTHMKDYHDLIGTPNKNIIDTRLIKIRSLLDEEKVNENLQGLKSLYDILKIPSKLPNDQVKDLNKILDELLYRMIEPLEKKYEPTIIEINVRAKALTDFIYKLKSEPDKITFSDTRRLMRRVAEANLGTHSKKAAAVNKLLGKKEKADKIREDKYETKLKEGDKHGDLFVCKNECQLLFASFLDSITDKMIQPTQSLTNLTQNHQTMFGKSSVPSSSTSSTSTVLASTVMNDASSTIVRPSRPTAPTPTSVSTSIVTTINTTPSGPAPTNTTGGIISTPSTSSNATSSSRVPPPRPVTPYPTTTMSGSITTPPIFVSTDIASSSTPTLASTNTASSSSTPTLASSSTPSTPSNAASPPPARPRNPAPEDDTQTPKKRF